MNTYHVTGPSSFHREAEVRGEYEFVDACTLVGSLDRVQQGVGSCSVLGNAMCYICNMHNMNLLHGQEVPGSPHSVL